LRVAVVEPNDVGSGGTGRGYGILSLADDAPGQFELTRNGLFLWNQLVGSLPAGCCYQRGGCLWIAADDSEVDEAFRRAQLFHQHGIDAELLNSRQLAEAEPALRPDLAGGLYVAEEGWLLAGKAAEFLLQIALEKGAKSLRHKAVQIDDHQVTLDDGTVLYAGNIVNAAGLDASALTPGLPLAFSKGHLMAVQTAVPCIHHQISALGPVVDIPNTQPGVIVRFRAHQDSAAEPQSGSGELWIGSSHQDVAGPAASLQVEPRIIAALLRSAIDRIPAIGDAHPLRSWAAFRSYGTDGLPLIGAIPGREGVLVATGHGSYGTTTALSTAKLIADEILSRTPDIDPNPYRPDRFEGKS
jgi:glycine/D-amino acid oxidase-like deaminating enzyme